MKTRSTRSAEGYSKAFWERLREELAQKATELGSWEELGEAMGAKGNTLYSFFLGRSKGLSQETLDKLHVIGLDIAKIVEDTTPRKEAPKENWTGETKTVKQSAQDKGYSEATIRKYCRDGKLDYLQNGRRIVVVVDEKYQALPETEKAVLRKKVVALEEENQALRKELEEIKSGQKRFPFMEEETESESEPIGSTENFWNLKKEEKLPCLPCQPRLPSLPSEKRPDEQGTLVERFTNLQAATQSKA